MRSQNLVQGNSLFYVRFGATGGWWVFFAACIGAWKGGVVGYLLFSSFR